MKENYNSHCIGFAMLVVLVKSFSRMNDAHASPQFIERGVASDPSTVGKALQWSPVKAATSLNWFALVCVPAGSGTGFSCVDHTTAYEPPIMQPPRSR